MNWSYIAGFIDGEGCMDLNRGSPRLRVSQKFPKILHEMQMFARVGRVRPETSGFVWTITGEELSRLLGTITRELRCKQSQAEWLQAVFFGRRCRPRRSPIQRRLVEVAGERLRVLKGVDYA